ncbi:hypothetical protein CDL15_Pgr015159 [Punica granatum]|uniref:Uncharacterized protein n=1 Tax=Punica granatum TaxID=22663 RepID=A0A218VZ10_PUNGR|nr:hypothetical protein CDL15_Pgr015159 [Punica granatum]
MIERNPGSDLIPKRKQPYDGPMVKINQEIYTCENPQCPYSDYWLHFMDKSSRNNHQLNCPFQKYHSASQRFGGIPKYQVASEFKPVVSRPFAQPNPTTGFGASRLSLPEDGQRIISDLMSYYSTNQPRNKGPSNTKVAVESYISRPSQKVQHSMDENFGRGVINIPEEANGLPPNHSVFQPIEIQFHQCKAFDSPFNPAGLSDSIGDFRFSSPFNLATSLVAADYTVSLLPKQDVSMWYL